MVGYDQRIRMNFEQNMNETLKKFYDSINTIEAFRFFPHSV